LENQEPQSQEPQSQPLWNSDGIGFYHGRRGTPQQLLARHLINLPRMLRRGSPLEAGEDEDRRKQCLERRWRAA
jgi:hypothetical protein